MKNRATLVITLLITITTFAQQGINYKAVKALQELKQENDGLKERIVILEKNN